MSNQLPEEKLNELLPGLSRLAELISAGETPGKGDFHAITSSIDINGQEWAIKELELWCDILIKSREVSYSEDKIIAELRDRGIPEFPAKLAYQRAKPQPMKADSQFVDFGTLKIGERAEPRTLTVIGERVIKVICGSRVKVTLLDSGIAKTLVRIHIADGAAGEIIKDEITLRGFTGVLRIPVTAQWEAEPPLLSWCPNCGGRVGKKSLFFNKINRKYECLNLACRCEFPYPETKVDYYNKTHK